jgi:hypothetical protein
MIKAKLSELKTVAVKRGNCIPGEPAKLPITVFDPFFYGPEGLERIVGAMLSYATEEDAKDGILISDGGEEPFIIEAESVDDFFKSVQGAYFEPNTHQFEWDEKTQSYKTLAHYGSGGNKIGEKEDK